jgi:hypothetical protein
MKEQGWYSYTCQERCVRGGQEASVLCACGAGSALGLEVHCKKRIEISALEKNRKTLSWPLLLLSESSGGARNAEAPWFK